MVNLLLLVLYKACHVLLIYNTSTDYLLDFLSTLMDPKPTSQLGKGSSETAMVYTLVAYPTDQFCQPTLFGRIIGSLASFLKSELQSLPLHLTKPSLSTNPN